MALGVGIRREGDYQLAVRIQTKEAGEVLDVAKVHEQARGEVDIRFIGELQPFQGPWHQQRQRPLVMGASVAHTAVTAGTIGAFVKAADGQPAILSNNHVLANSNNALAGDAVLQPGPADGGADGDRIAALQSFVPLQPGTENYVDAAIATLDRGADFDARHMPEIGTLAGVGSYYDAQAVGKTGRTTGTTRGFVSAVEVDYAVVSYPIGYVPFDDQLEIQSVEGRNFSEPGDSGSLIVDIATMQAVGLLFAGNTHTGVTFACPIDRVLQELGASLF